MLKKIGTCLACVYLVMDALGRIGEHERSVTLASGGLSNFPKCTAKSMKQFFYKIVTAS